MEQEKKKLNLKIIISVIIAIVVIAVLGGIIIEQQKQQRDINVIKEKLGISDTKEKKTTKEKQDDTKTISLEELLNHIKKVDITTENWKDYFEFEQTTEETKDAFEEVTGSQTHNILKLKDNNSSSSVSSYAVLEIEIPKEKASWETKQIAYLEGRNSYEFYGYINGTITTDEINCTKAKGSVFYLDLPDNYWNLDKENNQYFICIKDLPEFHYYKEDNLINYLGNLRWGNNEELISNCSALKDVEILKE